MPLRNRATPLGEIVADPARGLVYGNRGCLHDEQARIRRRYNGKLWISCRLEFKGWRRSRLMQPGRFTELFFLDEVTAFAAGHRPCALCRREDYDRFLDLYGATGAREVNERLHLERVDPITRSHRLHQARFDDLPDGAFVLDDGAPKLVLGDALLTWTPGGYTARKTRPRGQATLITPPSLVAVLRQGFQSALPLVHPTAS